MSVHDDRREQRAFIRFALIEELIDPGLTEDGRRLVFARLLDEGIEIDGIYHHVGRSNSVARIVQQYGVTPPVVMHRQRPVQCRAFR